MHSIVVRAAHVVAALCTHQLAPMPCKPRAARRTDLAMMIDRIDAFLRIPLDGSSTIWDKVRVESAGTLRQHG